MTAFRVGLTGGIASGKSTVARLLSEAGIEVFDADRLVAELYRPGAAGAREVARLFGHAVLDRDGAVDHQRLARRVFGDPNARALLEQAIHPLVREEFERQSGGLDGPVVLEATLLVEAGYAPGFDWIVTVEATRQTRLERAVERGMARDAAEARLVAQGDGTARRAAADQVIENEGTLDDLGRSVSALAADLRHRWRRKAATATPQRPA